MKSYTTILEQNAAASLPLGGVWIEISGCYGPEFVRDIVKYHIAIRTIKKDVLDNESKTSFFSLW